MNEARGSNYAQGNSSHAGNSTWNGGCIRPDCLARTGVGGMECGWCGQL